MQTFLDQLALQILKTSGLSTAKTCVVLPGRRACLYLRNSLLKLTDKTIWAPDIFSIDDFVYHVTYLRKINPVSLQFKAFQAFQEIAQDDKKEFADFMQWSTVVLNDFNDVDMALANPEVLFSNLTETKVYNVWNLGEKPLTAFEKKYIHFYQSLGGFYLKLKASLHETDEAYPGLAYRILAERTSELVAGFNWEKIVFAGFGALTNAEKQIFQNLKKEGLADFSWDVDEYYLKDKKQEAGDFIRENLKLFELPEPHHAIDSLLNEAKNISLIGVPQRVGQAKYTGQLLSEIQKVDPNLENTTVILNDPSLIAALLPAIPESVKNFNLTMGLPLSDTQLFKFLVTWMEMILKGEVNEQGQTKYYYKNVLSLLNHPVLAVYWTDRDQLNEVYRSILQSNKYYLSSADIQQILPLKSESNAKIEKLFFSFKGEVKQAIIVMQSMLHELRELGIERKANNGASAFISMQGLTDFIEILSTLEEFLHDNSIVPDLKTLRQLFIQLTKQVSIPYTGEPLQGLQIMGMLESRTLDFENVIMVSVNEDYIPGGGNQQSFIPFEVRKEFDLQTQWEKHAIFAYHFYRALQRAKNISLIYNSEPGDLGGGEKSRFITQLQHEFLNKNKLSELNERQVSLPVKIGSKDEIVIERNEAVKVKLQELINRGFSASALNTYRNCSLKFYFQYIAGVREEEEMEETIESATMGTAIHNVLEQIYLPMKGEKLSSATLKQEKPKIRFHLERAFQKIYEGGDLSGGKNLLILEVSLSYLNSFLDAEIERLEAGEEIHFVDAEWMYQNQVSFQSGYSNSQATVNLMGKVDRIDTLNGKTRIIDYKTGKVEQKELKVENVEQFEESGKFDKAFQLLFYAYNFWLKNNDLNQLLIPGIYSFRSMKLGLLELQPVDCEMPELLDQFDDWIKKLLDEIVFSDQDFVQTENTDSCLYCAFKEICQR